MDNQILFFDVILKERIWGDHNLDKRYGQNNSQKIGEAWLVSGHENGQSIIKNGKYEGMGLGDLYKKNKALFGKSNYEKFPLLIKVLDAKDDLSVQVHPNDDYARINHNDYGKNECWYVLNAQPNANIIYGQNVLNKEAFVQMIEKNEWDKVLSHINVQKGDFFYVPAGKIHAIGKGIEILEVQQSSDVTYRLYDYDRRDNENKLRDLHIDRALEVIDFSQNKVYPSEQYKDVKRYISTKYFTVDGILLQNEVQISQNEVYSIVYNNGQEVQINIDNQSYVLEAHQVALITSKVKSFSVQGNSHIFLIREEKHAFEKTYQFK